MMKLDARSIYNSTIQKLYRKARRFLSLQQVLGFKGAVHYSIQELQFKRKMGRDYLLYSKRAQFPLKVRAGTSDICVFGQIFIDCEYSCLDDISNVKLIVDCGANVGYSSAYFLSRFKNGYVIGIEPDPSNFHALSANLAPYNSRVKLVHAGVWSHPTELRISKKPYRDEKEWAVQVEECEPGERGEIRAVDIQSILEDSGYDRISILKVDIEGAEAIVFSKNVDQWIKHVDVIVIELHDDSMFGPASDLVKHAISTHGNFTVSRNGELTIFKSGAYLNVLD